MFLSILWNNSDTFWQSSIFTALHQYMSHILHKQKTNIFSEKLFLAFWGVRFQWGLPELGEEDTAVIKVAAPERRSQHVHVHYQDHSHPARHAPPAERSLHADPFDMNNAVTGRRRARTPSPEREASAAPTTVLDPSELLTPKVSTLYTHVYFVCVCVCVHAWIHTLVSMKHLWYAYMRDVCIHASCMHTSFSSIFLFCFCTCAPAHAYISCLYACVKFCVCVCVCVRVCVSMHLICAQVLGMYPYIAYVYIRAECLPWLLICVPFHACTYVLRDCPDC